MWLLLLKGFLMGILVAAPIGPTGLMWLHRILSVGRRYGFYSGLGSAFADTFYAAMAYLGLTFISQTLETLASPIQLGVGAFFLILGTITFFRRIHLKEEDKLLEQKKIFKAQSSGFLITLMNPQIILMFTGFFAVLHINNQVVCWQNSVFLLIGVFTGSVSVWAFFAAMHWKFHHHLKDLDILIINKSVGFLLFLAGAAVVVGQII